MDRTKRFHADVSSKEVEKGEESSSTATAAIANNIEPMMSSTADAAESVPIPPVLMVRTSAAVTTPARATTSAARQAPSPMPIRKKLEFEEDNVHQFIYQRGDRGDRELNVFSNAVIIRSRSDTPKYIEYYRAQYEGPECIHVGDAEDEIDCGNDCPRADGWS